MWTATELKYLSDWLDRVSPVAARLSPNGDSDRNDRCAGQRTEFERLTAEGDWQATARRPVAAGGSRPRPQRAGASTGHDQRR